MRHATGPIQRRASGDQKMCKLFGLTPNGARRYGQNLAFTTLLLQLTRNHNVDNSRQVFHYFFEV